MNNIKQRFYSNVKIACVLLGIIAVAYFVLAGLATRPNQQSSLMIRGVVVTALIPFLFYVRFAYPLTINASGMGATDFWGQKRFLNWEEMGAAKGVYVFIGCKYLVVKSTQNPKKYAMYPFFLEDKKGFSDALKQFAPPNSIVRQYFGRD